MNPYRDLVFAKAHVLDLTHLTLEEAERAASECTDPLVTVVLLPGPAEEAMRVADRLCHRLHAPFLDALVGAALLIAHSVGR